MENFTKNNIEKDSPDKKILPKGEFMDKDFMKDYLLNNLELKQSITDLYKKHYVDVKDSSYIRQTNGMQRFKDFQNSINEIFSKYDVFTNLPKDVMDSYAEGIIRIANGSAGTYKTTEGTEFNAEFENDPDKFYQAFVDFTLTDKGKPSQGHVSDEAIN